MTFAPKSLLDLESYWKAEGGRSLGIVGDTDHQAKGISYHLGKDQLIAGAYSATRPRDKAGLTNAASAIDLGALNGSLQAMRDFGDWLARRCVKGVAGTEDVVEVIYSPDGQRILRFLDGIDYLIPGGASLSHRYHTHISFFRDSEHRDKTALFQPYFLPDSSTEDPVIEPGDDINYGWESYTLDGGRTVYCIGGPRNPDGTTDPAMRLCFAGTGSSLATFVAKARLTNGKALPASDHLLQVITSGQFVVDCDDVVAAELERASVRASAAVLAKP